MWPFGRSKRADNLGRRGERLARNLLRRKGMKILATNYRCPVGEVDLIALDRSTRRTVGAETIVFVEVKTRASDRFASPESAVNADKQRRIGLVADYYLSRRSCERYGVRNDIVSVVIPLDGGPELRHIEDAF